MKTLILLTTLLFNLTSIAHAGNYRLKIESLTVADGSAVGSVDLPTSTDYTGAFSGGASRAEVFYKIYFGDDFSPTFYYPGFTYWFGTMSARFGETLWLNNTHDIPNSYIVDGKVRIRLKAVEEDLIFHDYFLSLDMTFSTAEIDRSWGGIKKTVHGTGGSKLDFSIEKY
jgi:hypothetical protein